MLGRVATAIGEAGGTIGSVDLIAHRRRAHAARHHVDAAGEEHGRAIAAAVDAVEGAEVVDTTDRTFLMHLGGKIEQRNKHPLSTRDDLSMAYTPGVARVCSAIAQDRDKAFQYTIKRNTVAVVSDGSAVLGLGDIGPEAAMPVMEGKAMLFKEFGGVDAFPLCLDTKDPDEIVAIVKAHRPHLRRHQPRGHLRPALLRDRGAAEGRARHPRLPRRPARHRRRRARRAAQRRQAAPASGSRTCDVLVVGLGAAGIAVAKILLAAGVTHIDRLRLARRAAHRRARTTSTARCRRSSAGSPRPPTPSERAGGPADVIDGADLFIGLSGARVMPAEALARMNRDAMVFAMANPNPEVTPEEAAPYARIIATGRSDYPNQINNVLCFPGIFRGALDVRAREITEEMKMAAARGIAAIVADDELREEYIVPSVFNRDVADSVAAAVAGQAKRQGAAEADERRDRLRRPRTPSKLRAAVNRPPRRP